MDTDTNKDHSQAFLLHNGGDSFIASSKLSDIEMITIQSVTYTSLCDLLPISTASAGAIISPTDHNSSWHEIPIRNPLVKHAALAYLQPMSSPPAETEKGFLGRFKEKCWSCSGECGCFSWMYDVVWGNFKESFLQRFEKVDDDDDDDDYYDDEDKVD